ncbi:hypothetical protein F4818DRAFT_439178 [Hypoxylon cercidicola]|nr:hypothetical protein F4818DRAFT_439178 [Hypoxylon cercidicola]
MQRLGGAWRPHIPVLPPPSKIRVRFKHQRPWSLKTKDTPLRSNYRIFEASTLVLDLDAEDSPYVRPYDTHVDGVPKSISQYRFRMRQPMSKRVAKFEKLSTECDEYAKLTASDKFSPWRISDHDILSIALGDSKRVQHSWTNPDPHRHSDVTSSILKWNGIPRHVRNNSSTIIAYMRRRQQLSHRLQPDVGDEESLNEALRALNNFPTFKRLIVNVVQTPQGCQLVSNCSESLVQAYEYLARETPPTQMLPFLNNLIINLDSQGIPISTSVLWCAYLTSLRCGVFSMAQKYLKRIHDNNHLLDSTQISSSLKILEMSMAPYNLGDTKTPLRVNTVHQLLAIYSLLTGRILGENILHPSLYEAVLNYSGFNMVTHLTCLARLGAFRTMWHLWRTEHQCFSDDFSSAHKGVTSEPNTGDITEKPSGTVGASDTEAVPDDMLNISKARAFAHAIQAAIGSDSRFVELVPTPDFARATGQYNEDCQLDIEAIIRSADIVSTGGNDQSSVVGDEEISEIFSKGSIQESLLALQSYLSHIAIPESG